VACYMRAGRPHGQPASRRRYKGGAGLTVQRHPSPRRSGFERIIVRAYHWWSGDI